MEIKANTLFGTRAFAQAMSMCFCLLCFSPCKVRDRKYALFPGGTSIA